MFLIVAVAFGIGYTIALTDPDDWDADEDNKHGNYISGIFFYTWSQVCVAVCVAVC